MGRAYRLKPRQVPGVHTRYRRIVTSIPVPGSVPVLQKLRKYEPVSMTGQPPVVWHRARGFQVEDAWGNRWIDFSSGVLVANAGHNCPDVQKAILKQVRSGLLHNYCFPSAVRGELAKKLVEIAPRQLNKVFILTTGSEATENAIKLARTYGLRTGGRKKIGIVSFAGAFHGRTLGAQMIGGIPAFKEWIVNLDPDIHQVPFPGDFRCTDRDFSVFEKTLAEKGVGPERIAGVITETYQGGGASFAPKEYIRRLARWCRAHGVVLVFDEVQAGFGRTGTLFGFEHYGVVPDLVCLGKGISSSLPISAVLGRGKIMDLYGPGEMTSTHTGNPLSCAAALASIGFILNRGLVSNARKLGEVFHSRLNELAEGYPGAIGAVHGKGLVAGVHMIQGAGNAGPDGELAFRIVERMMEKGVLLFAPVGFGGATIKIAPPLCITRDAVEEGVEVMGEALREVLDEMR